MSNSYKDSCLKIFSLNSNKPLAEKIAKSVGVELGKSSVQRFSDGEMTMNIEESIRGDEVYVIQSTSYPVNDHLLELLIMIDALKRASAKTINVVMPYFGYARQDRTAKPREPITAKLVADLIEKAGATRVLTLDLHTVQLQGFFDIPVDNLFTMPLFAKHYQDLNIQGEGVVVVSPKNSGVTRARVLAKYLDASLAIVDQSSRDEVEREGYVIGDVKGKTCVIVDDMINTGETIGTAAKVILAAGAKKVYMCASHGLFSDNAVDLLSQIDLEQICVTDSIYLPPEKEMPNLEIVTASELMADGLKRIHENKAMSPLFGYDDK